jgi:hypothetical protein
MSFSTVAKGNAFERHAVHLLNTDLRMAVRRVGGRGDGGIDLRGYWWLPLAASKSKRRSGSESSASDAETPPRPSTPELESHTFRVPPGLRRTGLPNTREIAPLRIIAQCKAESARVGPKYVRELAGTLGSLGASSLLER